MLVLSRKCGEQICVPDCGLVVTVLGVSRSGVRLGFSAPEDVSVFRGEVWARIECDSDTVEPARDPPSRQERALQTPRGAGAA